MDKKRRTGLRWTALLLVTVGCVTLTACGESKVVYSNGTNGAGNVYGQEEGLLDGGYYQDAVVSAAVMGTVEEAGDSYTQITENPFVAATEEDTSYFSIDANTAAYPNLRSLIRKGYPIAKDAVRVEEMLNYFDYDYPAPTDGNILSLTASVFDTPYNSDTKLLTIGLAAQEVTFETKQNNLVFLIDVSGSMDSSDKLPLVQDAFWMLAENLNDTDRVSIVTYAGSDRVALEGAYGHEKQRIVNVVEDLMAGGSTAGSEGIETAYRLAEKYFIEGGNNRVILATDGDFNVGLTDNRELEDFISGKRKTGVYFSVIGVGRGNLQAETMETLALNGNGTYHYMDSATEARRALVEQIGGSMVTVARDVKAGVTFNAEYVDSYRLVGYENKRLTQEEFENEATDAGELGSGHTVTVVYEIKLTHKALAEGENLAQVTVRYKPTENSETDGQEDNRELVMDIKTSHYHREMTATDAFVSSVVEFALVLRESEYKGDASLEAVEQRLNTLDLAADPYKEEFRQLVRDYGQSNTAVTYPTK